VYLSHWLQTPIKSFRHCSVITKGNVRGVLGSERCKEFLSLHMEERELFLHM
jgi:hypothetical protein